jgi:hypothetical protein
MKKILLLLAVTGLVMTGCQSTHGDNTARAQSNQSDWTYGGGAIGLP